MYVLQKRKRVSNASVSTSPKKQKTHSTHITPTKTSNSFTQPTPRKTKQSSSQKTPTKRNTICTQATTSTHSVRYMATVGTKTKSYGPSTHHKDKTTQIQALLIDIELSKHCDDEIQRHTGISTYALFNIIYNYVNTKCDDENCEVENHKIDPAQFWF